MSNFVLEFTDKAEEVSDEDDAINVAPYEALDGAFSPLFAMSLTGAASKVGASLAEAVVGAFLYPEPPKRRDISLHLTAASSSLATYPACNNGDSFQVL